MYRISRRSKASWRADLPARLRPASTIVAIATAIVTKATSAAAAIFTWFGFVDLEGTTTEFLAIELLNRRIRF